MELYEIIEYTPELKPCFVEFNSRWILDNFGFLEEDDHEVFDRLEDHIAGGAMVFFALKDGMVAACCMIRPLPGEPDNTWEFCKLGASSSIPHPGVGKQLLRHAVEYAGARGAGRIYIISNRKLKPALHIYESFGFSEIPVENNHYVRGDIAMEYRIPKSPGNPFPVKIRKKKDRFRGFFAESAQQNRIFP